MNYRWLVVARVLHVIAIVVWIGGIAVVTTVIFPAMRRLESNEQKVWLFEQVERRFRPQEGEHLVCYLTLLSPA